MLRTALPFGFGKACHTLFAASASIRRAFFVLPGPLFRYTILPLRSRLVCVHFGTLQSNRSQCLSSPVRRFAAFQTQLDISHAHTFGMLFMWLRLALSAGRIASFFRQPANRNSRAPSSRSSFLSLYGSRLRTQSFGYPCLLLAAGAFTNCEEHRD